MTIQKFFRLEEVSCSKLHIVTCKSDYRHGFKFANRFIGYSHVVTKIISYILKIAVTIAHKVFSVC
jgi:hypothetical protein